MAVYLALNAIPAIVAGNVNLKPLLQVHGITTVKNGVQDRHRLVVSDGVSTIHAILTGQLNDRVKTGCVQQGSVVQILENLCNVV